MSFINWIVERLGDIADFNYAIYLEVKGWVYPFDFAAPFFYEIYRTFRKLSGDFFEFGLWVDDTVDKIRDILTWSSIRSLIVSWLPDLEPVITWWQSWWTWIGQEIDEWWLDTKWKVRGWIDDVTQGFEQLKVDWNNFWTVTLPTLVSFSWLTEWWNTKLTDVNDLVSSWFVTAAPFWEGWQEWRDKVIEFFTDPEEWLYKAIDRIFERFW